MRLPAILFLGPILVTSAAVAADPIRSTTISAVRGKITAAKFEWGMGVGGSGQANVTVQGVGAPCRAHVTITHVPTGATASSEFTGEPFPVTRGFQPASMGMTTVGFKPGDYTITVAPTPQDNLKPDRCDGAAGAAAKGRTGELQKVGLAAPTTAGMPARFYVEKTYAACSFHLVLRQKSTNKEVTFPKNMEMSDTVVQQFFGPDPFAAGDYTATVRALDTDKAKGDACVGVASANFTVGPATPKPVFAQNQITTASSPTAAVKAAGTYTSTWMEILYSPQFVYKAGQPVLLKVGVVGGQGVKGCYGEVRNRSLESGAPDLRYGFQVATAWHPGLKKAAGNATIDLSQDAYGSASKPGKYGWTLVRNPTSPFPDYPPCLFDESKPMITNGNYVVAP